VKIKIAGTLTAAQEGAVHRAKAYHGKQPYQEFYADCVIWYKNDWAVIIPITRTVPYYWEGVDNPTVPYVLPGVPTISIGAGGASREYIIYDSFGVIVLQGTGTYDGANYVNWPSGGVLDADPSKPGNWNGGLRNGPVGAPVDTDWTPSYTTQLGIDTAIFEASVPAHDAALLAQHTAVIDTFKNATPPAVSASPATSVTVTVGATSALAHASVSASPTGLSSFTEIGAVLTVASAPLVVTLVPDLSDAEDEVIRVDFYRNGVLFATSEANPFTHEMTVLAVEVAVYSAMYTDASEVTDVAALTVTGLLSHVEFFRGEVSIADVATPPYACADPTLAVGEYTYSAVVYDDAGVPSAGEVTVSAVGPALTGDALTSVAASVPIAGRPIDAEHDYARPYFDGTFWKRGGIAYLIPLSPMAGGEERGMYYDLRLDADLTDLKVEGYARLRCGDAADLTAPITILDWVPVSAATLPIDGSFPMYVVRVADATNYGEYPTFGWWYDEVEQIQKADMALDPAPNFEIALFDFTRDTIT
jgi:hypothetical protein